MIRTLFPSARSGPTVIAVSPDAWVQGIRPGLPLAEARSMARPLRAPGTKQTRTRRQAAKQPEVAFFEWSPDEDRRQLTAVAELTRSFAPVVGADSMPVPDCLLLNITGCAPLFGSETTLAEHLLRKLRLAGWTARIAVADTVAAAWAFVHADGHWAELRQQRSPASGRSAIHRRADWNAESSLPVLIIPPGAQQEHLEPLPITAIRLQPADSEILEQLGIRTIRQVFRLPSPDLPSRLSADAVQRLDQIRGISEEQIDPIPEADPVVAQWASEFPAENTDEVRQVLEHLIEQITAELTRRKTGCIRLICSLKCEGDVERSLTIDVIRPSQSPELFRDVVGLRLEAAPFPEAVYRATMQAVTAPLPVARQRDLFSSTAHVAPVEELTTLLDRLSGRLGREATRTIQTQADARPEFGFATRPVHSAGDTDPQATEQTVHSMVTPTQETAQDAVGLFRPVRLLPVPFLIHRGPARDLMQNGFAWQGQRFRIAELTGPERIQTAWWDDTPVHRDYFRLRTDSDSMFWIYRDLRNTDWFLHGIFD
ncbi:MAG: DNA polymerase Y family protein [Planctomycetaceae bacterium]|nr:DNA polymerase Y family protein [Planctomycetaceae bacterium]